MHRHQNDAVENSFAVGTLPLHISPCVRTSNDRWPYISGDLQVTGGIHPGVQDADDQNAPFVLFVEDNV